MLMLLIFTFCLSSQQVMAASAKKNNSVIMLNGQQLKMPGNVQVQNVNNNIMVPIRVIVENLGFDTNWNQKQGKVTVSKADSTVELTIGRKVATVNGADKKLNIAPLIQSNTSLVPLRFISEEMGLTVGWDNKNKIVSLESLPDEPIMENPPVIVTPSKPTDSTNSGEGEFVPGHTNSGEGTPITPTKPINGAAVNSISFYDNRLMVGYEGSTQPNVVKMTNPDRIVMELPNTQFSNSFNGGQSTGDIQVVGNSNITSIHYTMVSQQPPMVRIEMPFGSSAPYSFYAQGSSTSGQFVIDLNGQSLITDGKKIVVIDAGHGGYAPGTTGYSKKKEKEFNLAVALKVGRLLEQESKINIIMTRSDDTAVELTDRGKIANNLNADVFVSIHGNSAGVSTTAHGTESYYYNDRSKAFTELMHRHLLAATGFTDRKVKYKSLQVLRDATMPATLLEIGFLSNPAEESTMLTEDFQQRVAQSIVDGIKEYLGV
ncbi:hypothetical protein JCM16418A_12100 [Paenibacillus pini]